MLHNAGGAANGPVDMSDALKVSSDVYFYSLGLHASASGKGHGQIQDWAHTYGLGRNPGIDIARRERRPDPDARVAQPRLPQEPQQPLHRPPLDQGDNVNLADRPGRRAW